MNLGAGPYVVMGRGEVNNNGGATTTMTGVACSLIAGATTAIMGRNMILGANGTAGESEVASAFLVHTFAAPGQAVIECTTSAAWGGGNVIAPQMVVLKVQP